MSGNLRLGCWILLLLAAAGRLEAGHGTPKSDNENAEPAPFFEGLGQHHHRVTTHVPVAQRYFDQGLRFVYAFNHDEAIRSFRAAAEADPNCAMAQWGIALALGPNYNLNVDEARQKEAYETVARAQMLAAGATPQEQAYIAAIAERFSADPAADRKQLDQNYCDAMRKLAAAYPDDTDAGTLFAVSAMELRPWDLWKHDGTPQPGTVEIVETLERVLRADPNHAGACHFYIHAVEASNDPKRAVAAADRLGGLMPGAGHMVHMPSHIYYRIGRYRDSAESNRKAILVDKAYIDRYKPQGVYTAMYYPHNVHFLWASLCELGESSEALAAAEQFSQLTSLDMVREMPMLEAFLPTKLFTLVRFGKWEKVLDEPQWPREFLYARGVRHYAQGVALVGLGRLDDARSEQAELTSLLAATPADAKTGLLNHSTQTLLGIALSSLRGRIAMSESKWNNAINDLREAVRLQDTLSYDEPPAWYYPVRQTLGAALLSANQPAEAEAVYREALADYPHNGWSLFGLAQALRAQNKKAMAKQIDAEFRRSWEQADVELRSSQF